AVEAEVADPAAPTGDALQSFCFDSPATIADLSPNAANIVWYASETNNTPLNSTDSLIDGEDYYASQIIDGCESDERLMVTVEILPEITLSATANTVTCDGEADGLITIENDEFSTITIYNSNNIDVTSDNGSLTAGIYTIVASLSSSLTETTCEKEITVSIEVRDNDAPVISVPSSLDVEVCEASELTSDNARFALDMDGSEDIKDIFEAAGYTASDDQTIESITYTDSFDESGCVPIVTRTFYVTDNCGSQTSATLTINLIDLTDPVFNEELPSEEITVECTDIPDAMTLTATDACTGVIAVNFSETTQNDDECGTNFTIIRTWTATDCSNNEVSFTQTINVIDTTAPVFDQELPQEELTVECDNIPAAVELTATDACEGFVDVNYNESIQNSDDCANTYVITRTWTATDCSNNEAVFTQTVNVVDTQAPEFVEELPAAELTVECGNVPDAEVLSVTDNCSENVDVVFTEELSGNDDNCANVYTITRTWTATDCANNPVSHIQIINVVDTVAPEFVEAIPGDMTMECENLPEVPVITAIDNCDTNVQVVYTEKSDKENDEDKEYVITRTWTATDCAGNEISASQDITIQNTGAPSFNENLPGDITVECDAIPEAAVITATDNCVSEIEVVFEESISGQNDECSNEYIITRTWTATDDANNQTSHTQTITVVDTVVPVFNEELPAAELTVECDSVPAAAILTATDNCSGAIDVVFTENFTGNEDGCSSVYTIVRNWVATDCAGNETSFTQTINVEDSVAPVFNEELPVAELTVECDSVPSATTLTATDNCSGAIDVVFTENITGNDDECSNVYTIVRNWVATDCAGNETSFAQTINVEDSIAPVFNEELPAAELTVECDSVPAAAILTATDNCSGDTGISFEELITDRDSAADNDYMITRSWMASDCAGNEVSFTQIIIVQDTSAPEITTCPAAITVSADAGICSASEVNLGMPTATDNCDSDLSITNNAPAVFELGETIITWTVTDESGNTVQCTQLVTVVDDQNPEIEAMQNITVNSDADLCGAVVNYGMAGASDNCELVSVELTEGLESGSVFPIGPTTVTYTATDNSGNTTSSSFTVTVIDNEAPVITCPQDINVTVEIGVTSSIINYDAVTASDNCEVSVEMTAGLASGSEFPLGPTVVTYTATDASGNSVECSFTVTVNEEELPEPPTPPSASVTTAATCASPLGTITVETQEGLTYSIDGENYQESGVFSDLDPDTYQVTAMDGFGQVSTAATITIEEPVAEEIVVAADPDLCIEDSVFDLFEMLTGEVDESGTWIDTDNTGALDNGFIDPSLMELGTYTFTYQLEGNCPSSTDVTVSINDDCVVLACTVNDLKDGISKVVTPNGDNRNDFFEVDLDTDCGFTYDLMIFNRWGNKIFEAQNYQNNWDGYSSSSFTGSNQLPSGTYYYVLQVRNSDFEPIQGYIYLGTK
ncbi:HYR domain-containing protein, partial [Christiangramia crocea]